MAETREQENARKRRERTARKARDPEAFLAKSRAANAKWEAAHPGYFRAKAKEGYYEHREERIAYSQAWRLAHLEEWQEYMRVWRDNHKEYRAEYMREWKTRTPIRSEQTARSTSTNAARPTFRTLAWTRGLPTASAVTFRLTGQSSTVPS